MIRFLLIIYFIVASIRYRVAPWRFFQLNNRYFNEEKGLFSKLEIDRVIPDAWRLHQELDDGCSVPKSFPVFVKPEWGQNSYAVSRADSAEMLQQIRRSNRKIHSRFMLQEAAYGKREFEIFYIRSSENFDIYSILSITEAINHGRELLPVNSVHNPQSEYRSCIDELSDEKLHKLWSHLSSVGMFRIARVGLRVDSYKDMLAGNFKIIEINIFLPMPLSLLDTNLGWRQKHRFIIRSMAAAARMVGTIPPGQNDKSIFFHKVRAHYRVKS